MVKVFVYGTLRRGQPAHYLLGGASLAELARTEPHFTLVDMGGYPALLEGGQTAVFGEIYEVDTNVLSELDEYEEVPDMYRRVVLRIAGHDVFVYVPVAEHAAGRPQLPGGDWCEIAAVRVKSLESPVDGK